MAEVRVVFCLFDGSEEGCPWWTNLVRAFMRDLLRPVAIVVPTAAAGQWWTTAVLQSQGQIAVFSPKKGQTLGMCLIDKGVPAADLLIVDLPPKLHTEVLRKVFLRNSFPEVISVSPPAANPKDFSELRALLIQQSPTASPTATAKPPKWQLLSASSYEPAFASFESQLRDMGRVEQASLVATAISPMALGRLGETATPPAATLVAAAASGLLHRFLGSMESAATAAGGGSVTGWAKFSSGVCCSLCLPDVPREEFELTVYTSLGRLTLAWDAARRLFTIQRNLKHFEHPGLYAATGSVDALAAALQSAAVRVAESRAVRLVLKQKHAPSAAATGDNSCEAMLRNLTVGEALCETTRGALVIFKAQ